MIAAILHCFDLLGCDSLVRRVSFYTKSSGHFQDADGLDAELKMIRCGDIGQTTPKILSKNKLDYVVFIYR